MFGLVKYKTRFYTFLIGIIVIIAIIISYRVASFETIAGIIDFVVTVLSLIISFFAFIVATLTYSSIDSVNNVTKMDGSVLENEDYVTSFNSLLRSFNEESSRELTNTIIRNLRIRFKKQSKTAIAFSNNLQYFIDLIVIFPLLFKSESEQKENMKKVDEIIHLIKKRQEALDSVSLGNLTLINETVKLIEAVMNYQQLMHKSKSNKDNIPHDILDVRGNMLKNAVSKTVYYNYLGLFYNKKAMGVIKECLQLEESDFLSIEGHKTLLEKKKSTRISDKDKELLSIYLSESKKAFHTALECIQDDKMWNGFILYNDARTTYFYQLFFPEKKLPNWEELLNEAIVARAQLNILIKNLIGEKNTYFQEEFIYQEYLARLVKLNLYLVNQKDIPDTNQQIRYRAPDYQGLFNDRFIKEDYAGPSSKIKEYQQTIRSLLM